MDYYPTPEPTPTPNPVGILIKLPCPLFASKRKNGQYLFKDGDIKQHVIAGDNIVFPFNADSEYWQTEWNDHLKDSEYVVMEYKGVPVSVKLENHWRHGRYGVTTQFKGITQDEGHIFAHPDLVPIAKQLNQELRHPLPNTGFYPIDYLQALGLDIGIRNIGKVVKKRSTGEVLPVFEFVMYAHFALAEWGMIADGDFRQDMVSALWRSRGHRVEQLKLLRAVCETGFMELDSIDMPWVVNFGGHTYRVKISVKDSSGLHGSVNYQTLCETTNVPTPHKKLMDSYKHRMQIGYFEKPEDFDNYALGDLNVYKVLSNNSDLFKIIWDSLDISEYFESPKLTIGGTVASIFTAKLLKHFKIAPNDKEGRKAFLDKFCRTSTADYLKTHTHETLCLNAKVRGGRCRNNRPNLVKVEEPIADYDIDGCYGEGQRVQDYPLGKPIQESFKYPSTLNHYPTLREWLKARKWGRKDCELVPGLWQAVICTKEKWVNGVATYEKLSMPQDFFGSWFDFKMRDIAEMKTDTEKQANLNDEFIEVKSGQTKIFNHQIVNEPLTHDELQWIEHICSPKQKNELLDTLYVHTSIYYPSYDRVYTPENLLERVENHKGTNRTKSGKRKGGSYVCNVTQECSAWYSLNLGEFIIDDLLAWRKIYPKKNPDGTRNAMNTLYKLVVNTLYGDMVSPYFKISNVVVGNNITARARAMCWYTEKGLYGIESITDGDATAINTVVYPLIENRRVTAQSVVNLHRESKVSNRQLRLAPLGGYKKIDLNWKLLTDHSGIPLTDDDGQIKHYPVLTLHTDIGVERLEPELKKTDKPPTIKDWSNPAHDWANKIGIEHIRSLFPKVDVLHGKTFKLDVKKGDDGRPVKTFTERVGQFQFEVKSFYDRGVFHGSANYFLEGVGGETLAMRSYEKKSHTTPVMDMKSKTIAFTTSYSEKLTPAELFMKALDKPTLVERGKVFIKNGILKINEARKNRERWKTIGRIPGDTIQKSGLLREFSLSQFTFHTIEQFKSISREINFNKRQYCQSYEGFFINDDNTLNFQDMVTTIDKAIGEGAFSINLYLDRSRNRHRKGKANHHPESEILEKVREVLLKSDIGQNEDWIFDDIMSLTIVSDESGIIYEIDTDEYDFTNDIILEDDSLLDDIDFGF